MSNKEALRRQQALAEVGSAAFNFERASKLPDSPARGEILESARAKAKRAIDSARVAGLDTAQVQTQIQAARRSAELKVRPTIPQMENALGIRVQRKTKGIPQS